MTDVEHDGRKFGECGDGRSKPRRADAVRADGAARRPLCDLAARGETRHPRPRPVRRRRQPAYPVGADPRHRLKPLFSRRGLRRSAFRRPLHLSAVHLSCGDCAQHHVYVGAIGGIDHLGPRVRLFARNSRIANATIYHPARQNSWRHHGRDVPRMLGPCARQLCRIFRWPPPISVGAWATCSCWRSD